MHYFCVGFDNELVTIIRRYFRVAKKELSLRKDAIVLVLMSNSAFHFVLPVLSCFKQNIYVLNS
jgi:hypothetical protein